MEFIGQLIAFEAGQLDQDEVIALFQGLIDSGVVWDLQGSYGRTATALIVAGHCTEASLESIEATLARRPGTLVEVFV